MAGRGRRPCRERGAMLSRCLVLAGLRACLPCGGFSPTNLAAVDFLAGGE